MCAVAVGPNIKPVLTDSYEAGADLSAKQFFGVKFSADRKVILTASVTDVSCGVLLNKPKSAETAEVLIIGKVKMEAGETIVAGNQICCLPKILISNFSLCITCCEWHQTSERYSLSWF